MEVDVPQLVHRARQQDPAAWETLYRRAHPRLLAYARRRLPTDDAARDAVNDCIARAVRSIGRFRGDGGGFDAWLYGILRHVVLDAQRAGRRRPLPSGGGCPDLVDVHPGPDDQVVAREEAAQMRAAFERLSPADRELLELRVIGGLSSEDVGAVLGKRPGAVRMAQQRALDRLRLLLDDHASAAGSGDGTSVRPS